jgi:hypothetical protein
MFTKNYFIVCEFLDSQKFTKFWCNKRSSVASILTDVGVALDLFVFALAYCQINTRKI